MPLLRRCSLTLLALATGIACLCPTALAVLIDDPKTRMEWRELVTCELVVVGKYKSHHEGILTIHVERVLKGDAKVGTALDVELQHWWNVTTGPVDHEAMVRDAKGDGKPRICYKARWWNPGPLVPTPVVEPGESAIFFFLTGKPVLQRGGQISRVQLVEGWQKAVRGEPLDLAFRLSQSQLAERALTELKVSRDPKVLDLLVEEVTLYPSQYSKPQGYFHPAAEYRPHNILKLIGDKDGDVYERVLPKIVPSLDAPDYAAYRLGEVLGTVDPERAVVQFRAWVEADSDETRLRNVAISSLHAAYSPASMEFAISLLSDEKVGDQALREVLTMVANNREAWLRLRAPRNKHREVWEVARLKLKGTTAPLNLSMDSRRSYESLVQGDLGNRGSQNFFAQPLHKPSPFDLQDESETELYHHLKLRDGNR